ncbi:hypothetical protein [Slackia piriformis]
MHENKGRKRRGFSKKATVLPGKSGALVHGERFCGRKHFSAYK